MNSNDWKELPSPMTFDVDRVVDAEHAAVMFVGKTVGAINSDEWNGFQPGYLRVMRVTVIGCMDWRRLRLRFTVEFDPQRFPHESGPYRFETVFADLLSVGSRPGFGAS